MPPSNIPNRRQVPLPTMYDLPSENIGDPGVPDEFHIAQPRLLEETCQIRTELPTPVFTAIDLNLYFDARHPLWYKRPDWFLVLGVPRAEDQADLRLSYVIWQEGVAPFLVIELLSPGTEADDLGQTLRDVDTPPTKWQVYEQILRVPYYGIFDRYQNHFRLFRLVATRYEEMTLTNERFWFDEIQAGLGVWQGCYQGIEGRWLRWFDPSQNWIPMMTERLEQEQALTHQAQQQAAQAQQQAEQAQQRAEQERQRAERLAEQLRQLGIAPQ
jgi:Uma2 family endonuclease